MKPKVLHLSPPLSVPEADELGIPVKYYGPYANV